MTAVSYDNLRTRALQVMNETAAFANSETRVGSLLRDMVDSAPTDGIDPRAYGAAGTGLVDDKAAVLLAITAAVAAGKPVVGGGATYGIAGNLTLVANAWLRDISFKQLTPAAGTVRTLTSAGGDNIRLENVTVNRNGTGAAGAHQVDAGIYIDGGSGHYFEDVEVYGDDIGSGFALWNATDCDLVRVHAHDIKYLLGADPGNDRVQGIHIANSTRIRLRDCYAHDIGGNFGAGYTLRWSRGYCFSGTTDLQVDGCWVRQVDQGNDMTGGAGNSRFSFSDCYAIECMTWGFKFANTARDGQVDNCTAERCGLSGFVVSGPSGAGMTALASSDILFTGCVSYDSGYATFPGGVVAGTKIGFRVMEGGFDPGLTRGVRFVGCKAHDRQAVPTMAYGFHNDVALSSTDGRYNEAINCVSIGHTGAAFQDLHRARCEVRRNAVQVIGTGAWTAVDWNVETDYGGMHDVAVNNDSVFARRTGAYAAHWGAVFAASATGQRGVRILRNGVVIAGTTVLAANAGGGGTVGVHTSFVSMMDAGDGLKIEVFQDSGGDLDLQTTSGGVVEQVG